MSYLYNVLSESFNERLETKQLVLRPYEEGDESDFMRVMLENGALLNPAFGNRLARVKVLDDARTQMRQLRTDWENRKVFDFGVWLKEDKTYIGDITLKNLDYKIPKAELGLYFTEWPATRSLALQAMQEVVVFGFRNLSLQKIYLRCTEANAILGALALEAGFQLEGTLRSDYRGATTNELLDLSYYGITLPDFEQLQQLKEAKSKVLA
ncbi:GNAT family N-acetyltransferase [Pontibacter qinzhouensis]|uniref:GNAT family N-acetyltransferase n=1 Tax=Pontibacter qinzhouensis TaxID=2603253 RepID=A0A5C8K862_9BACT|nr:GNAT family protein [Pontibacter qinzhouensis]TXK44920.1 GNAT family N-acetyltransferase [Pontibacter qinzhouensis]